MTPDPQPAVSPAQGPYPAWRVPSRKYRLPDDVSQTYAPTSKLDAPMNPLKGFGKRLQEARKRAGFATQEKLAKRLLVSRAAVSWWESEDDTPHPDKWDAIARAVDTPWLFLFFGVDAEASPKGVDLSPLEWNLLRLFGQLEPDQQDEVVAIAKSFLAQPEGAAAKAVSKLRRVGDVQPEERKRKKT